MAADTVGMTVGSAYIMTVHLIGASAGAATSFGIQGAGTESSSGETDAQLLPGLAHRCLLCGGCGSGALVSMVARLVLGETAATFADLTFRAGSVGAHAAVSTGVCRKKAIAPVLSANCFIEHCHAA